MLYITNKQEIISAMSEKMESTKKDAERALKAFQEVVTEELARGGKVRIVGFGTFDVVERKQRVGRNPKTSEEISIPAHKAVRFKVGKSFKEYIL